MTNPETSTRAVAWTVADTAVGPLLLAATEKGLVHVAFRADEATTGAALERLASRLGVTPEHLPDGPAGDRLREAVEQVEAYFSGTLRAFTLALDWSLSSGFHRRVLRELAGGVPFGSVVGYQDLANRVGEPGAARAVGVAMASNPLPVVVPCHRVLESDGGIGGFGGDLRMLDIKRSLLAKEGVLPEPLF
ncbi:methylated-DNA--[protein]-cysteine S-methyltransferase [Streptomyces sp. NPDC002574]|uniref:methylated-DNA--[protein]-cysteine S-methyltransferase n=1 Tax=Streptomyces sp. NPDC002574 TaxID=3364652 RepID=UPI0036946B36